MAMISKIADFIRVSLGYVALHLKVKTEYRGDFWSGFFGTVAFGVVNIVFIWALFEKIPHLRGWSFPEVLFIYGIGELTFGLFSMGLMRAIFRLPEYYIIEGNLDRNMVRPFPVLAQVIFENLNFNDVVIILKGLAILTYASVNMELSWSLPRVAGFFLLSLAGGLIYSGVFLLAASLSFWIKGRTGVFLPLFRFSDYSRFPMTIYPPPIRIFFSWVVPFAFVAFYPSSFIVRGKPFWVLFAAPLLALAVFSISSLVWNRGLNAYESTGT